MATVAQIEANRRNAQRSTGPKTPEGKARSRANRLIHGLAGSGECLLEDDRTMLAEARAAFVAEFAPEGEAQSLLVDRIALASVRLRRCEAREVAALADRLTHAESDYDEAKQAEAADLAARFHKDPPAVVAQLKRSSAGCAWLVAQWAFLAERLTASDRWEEPHYRRALDLLGVPRGESPCEERAWSVHRSHEGLDGERHAAAEDAWAEAGHDPAMFPLPPWEQVERMHRRSLTSDIAEEVAELEAQAARCRVREAREKANLRSLALIDTSRSGDLVRRYEAAGERALHRALADLARLKKQAAKGGADAPAPAPDPDSAPRVVEVDNAPIAVPVDRDGDSSSSHPPAPTEPQEVSPPRTPKEGPEALASGIREPGSSPLPPASSSSSAVHPPLPAPTEPNPAVAARPVVVPSSPGATSATNPLPRPAPIGARIGSA